MAKRTIDRLLRLSKRQRESPASGSPAQLVVCFDTTGRIESVRGDSLGRPLDGRFRTGGTVRSALGDIHESLADGLQDALDRDLPVAGVEQIVADGRTSFLAYSTKPGGDGPPELMLSFCPPGGGWTTPPRSIPHDVLPQLLAHINRVSAPDEAARNVLPLLLAATGASCGAVFAFDGAFGRAVGAYGPTRKRGFPYPQLDLRSAPVTRMTLRPGASVTRKEDVSSLPAALLATCPTRCGLVAAAPCFAGHAATGLLVVSRTSAEPPTLDQLRVLTATADAVGLALGNSTLSQETHLSEVVLETACAVARAVSGSLDLQETFRQIALSAARIMGDCRCLLLEADESRSALIAVASSDPGDDCLLGMRIRFDDIPDAGVVLPERRSLLVDDVVWGAGVETIHREKLAMRTALFVPITAEQSLIGSLLLFSGSRRENYSDGDIARAETVAEQAASAICNARLYKDLATSQRQANELLERITALRQRSRQQLASVIHDEIVQTIVAALYEIECVREAVEPGTQGDVDRVAALLRQTITEARDVIWNLRPPALEGLGLRGSLVALVDRISRETSAKVELTIADLPALDMGTQSALYMIAREALQNARWHSEARHITVSLGQQTTGAIPARLLLEVRDDGVGFEAARQRTSDHFGLTMMDEQTALCGGSLKITSTLGAGTRVRVLLPLPQPESGA